MSEENNNPDKKILIVEDEKYLRELYVEMLEEEGYSVDSKANGKDGYVAIKKGGYDLVLLDVMLPGIDGLEILKRIKDSPSEKPNKNIVLLTNLSMDLSISRGIALGIRGYLIKSDLTPGEFVEKVREYLK